MAEWLGSGLQNRVQQFDSAWYLTESPFQKSLRGLSSWIYPSYLSSKVRDLFGNVDKRVMWTKMVGDSDKSGWWLSFFNSPF